MASVASSETFSITPRVLAERLAHGERLTVLDIRDDAEWGIEAPGVTSRRVPATTVLADPGAVAQQLDGAVTVVCNRGIAAQAVAEALRQHGVDAGVLEGGMRGWILALAITRCRPRRGRSRRASGPAPGTWLPVLRDRFGRCGGCGRPGARQRLLPRARGGSSARGSPTSSIPTCTPTTSPAPARWPTRPARGCAYPGSHSSAASSTPSASSRCATVTSSSSAGWRCARSRSPAIPPT